MLRSYDELIDDLKESIAKLDKTKISKENEVHLNKIKKDGKEMLEALIFNLITNQDYFFGNFAIQMDREIDPLLPFAAGVGFNGYSFVLKLNPILFIDWNREEQKAVLIHEFYHVLLNHIFRGKYWENKTSHSNVNIAMDCAINQYIDNLPPGVTLEGLEKELNMKLEKEKEFEYYLEKIIEFTEQQKQQNQEQDQSSSNSQGSANDSNNQNKKDSKAEEQNENTQGNEEQDQNNSQEKKPEERGFRDKNDELTDHDWGDSQEESEDLAKEQLKNIVNEAYGEAMSKSRGDLPGGIEAIIKKINTPPEVKWETIFKRMKGSIPWGSVHSLIKPNRRNPYSYIHCGNVADRVVDVFILRDVSGSMMSELEYVSNEINGMLANTPSQITLVDWDTCVTDVKALRKASGFNNNKKKQQEKIDQFRGAGGTTITPAIEYFNSLKKSNAIVVVMSDFHIESNFPRFKCKNVLWLGSPDSHREFKPEQGVVKFLKPKKER